MHDSSHEQDGRHKDKRSKAGKKRNRDESGQQDHHVGSVSDKKSPEVLQSEKDGVIQMLKGNEGCRKIIKMISETGDEECGMQCFKAELHEKSGLDEDQMKVLECGIRWAVEAREKGRDEQQEQRRQDEQEQRRRREQGLNTRQEEGKQVRFCQEEQLEEMRAERTGEPEVTGRLAEMRTGRGSAGLVRGEMRSVGRTRPAGKAKERGSGGKGEHEGKGGGFGGEGKQQETREEEEERVRMAPNMAASG